MNTNCLRLTFRSLPRREWRASLTHALNPAYNRLQSGKARVSLSSSLKTVPMESGTSSDQCSKQAESSHAPSRATTLSDVLPPVDRGLHAWRFVVSATLLETWIWGGGLSFGTYQNWYTSSADSPILSSSISAVSAIGTTYLAIQYVLGFALMPLWRRYPQHIRAVLWTLLFVECASLVGASFATQTWQLILLQGVLPGIAGACFYGPLLLWIAEWFVERRGLAGGIIFCGTGAGGAVFPPVIGVLLQSLGFRWTLRIWAASFAIVVGLAIFYMRPRHSAASIRDTGSNMVDWTRFSSPVLAVVSATVFIQALGYFPVSIYIPTYTTSLGVSPLGGQLVLSVFNLFTLIGQVLLGYLCDRFSFTLVIVIAGIGSTLSAFLLWGFASDLGRIFAFVIFFGVTAGGFSSIFAPVGTAVFGSDSLSAGVIPGYLGALRGIAAIVGPIISASLYNPDGPPLSVTYGLYGFGKMEMFVGGLTAVTILGGFLSWWLTLAEKRRSKSKTMDG
ncbi:MFS general substrate transporter [Calocera viscosa TUFC12733]|uniref:MFS general substrate transporter n=1 Tax=Calocera viscosa (strain TUFC12733) TaxID=1330018 RepID=A0A167Q2A8_CALVF|nr:MFS general substrate transporter [Calocera viscosa TUFC12733]